MKRAALLVLSLLAACRPEADVQREAPLDFEALEGPTRFGTEATLAERWDGPLKASFDAAEKGSFPGLSGVPIAYSLHRASFPRATVVFVAGKGEPVRKYAELVCELQANGFTVWAMDHRGQGSSERLLANREKNHVETFSDYVTDLHTFITTVVKQDQVLLVAHSMGGAVAVLYADQHPERLSGMVLSSPMLDINTGAYPPPVAFSLSATACGATDGTEYALWYGDYKEDTDFQKVTATHSPARWDFKRKLYRDEPEIRVGGVTWRWLCESLTASSAAQGLGRYSAVPTLMFQAGEDRTIHPTGQTRYCADAPRCQLSRIEGAGHEVWQETDELRDLAVSRTLKFLQARSTR